MNYISLGSGSVAASGVLETEYKENMTFDEAKALAVKAISAGIIEDLGSGSQVDVCLINQKQYQMTRGTLVIGKRETEKNTYDFSNKKVPYIKEIKHVFDKKQVATLSVEEGGMDIEYEASK